MIRFLADASLRDAIIRGCLRREPTIDFLSAHDANLEGVPDPEVLALPPLKSGFWSLPILKTMPRHFGQFLQAGGDSAGVFLVKQHTPVADVIEALLLVWAASDADEWKNRILEIPEP